MHATTTAAVTIQKLQQTFATLGLPEILVSDNGAAFTSWEFQEFIKQNGITHLKTAPYHPGLAKRAVQTFKAAMKRMKGGGSVEFKVSRFCLSTEVTPHSTLQLSRPLRTHLDLFQSAVKNQVSCNQMKQKSIIVYIKYFSGKEDWLPGFITKVQGPMTYLIELEDERAC